VTLNLRDYSTSSNGFNVRTVLAELNAMAGSGSARRSWRRVLWLAQSVAVVSAAGCASMQLVPAPSARRVDGNPTAALAELKGVRVSADAQGWSGSKTIGQELTPVHLWIRNDSGQPVAVVNTEIMLVGPGHKLRALSPGQIRVHTEPEQSGADRALSVGAGARRFGDGADPGSSMPIDHAETSVSRGPTQGDPQRRALSAKEQGIQDELQRAALPQGPIQSGRESNGFAFFPRLPADLTELELYILVRDSAGKPLTGLKIPFVVTQ
jgi:hypothetical protein